MGNLGYGKMLGAALILVVGIGLLEMWDRRVAWTLAILIILALILRNPRAAPEIRSMLGL